MPVIVTNNLYVVTRYVMSLKRLNCLRKNCFHWHTHTHKLVVLWWLPFSDLRSASVVWKKIKTATVGFGFYSSRC